jgi:TRAP-type C4-dicarboxylate transport system permease large subunit
VPIPLFLLMGEVFFHTGLGRACSTRSTNCWAVCRAVELCHRAGRHRVLNAVGLVDGIDGAAGLLMVPEMTKRGYKKHMSIGPILGTGGLAIIIPPSALAVLLATLAQIDVGALLIAGVIPGLILACFYMATIYLHDPARPRCGAAYEVPPISAWREAHAVLRDVVPMVGLMVVIVFMMINGIVTPSEAAAFGALGVLILAVLFRCLSWEAIKKSVAGRCGSR